MVAITVYWWVSSWLNPAPIMYGINGSKPNIANAKNVTIPPQKGELSSTTKPNSYNIIILTKAWWLVEYKSEILCDCYYVYPFLT